MGTMVKMGLEIALTRKLLIFLSSRRKMELIP
jgi:hypothetical protein